jgi:hypothetical protein
MNDSANPLSSISSPFLSSRKRSQFGRFTATARLSSNLSPDTNSTLPFPLTQRFLLHTVFDWNHPIGHAIFNRVMSKVEQVRQVNNGYLLGLLPRLADKAFSKYLEQKKKGNGFLSFVRMN